MKRKADLMSSNSTEACNPEEVASYGDRMAIVPYEPVAGVLDNKKKKKKSSKPRQAREKIDNGPNPPPPIPTGFKDMIEKMGGTEWKLIIQKGLQKTDMSTKHDRLSMPSTLCKDFPFAEFIESNASLLMIDTKLKLWDSVSVKKWNMKKVIYVIGGDWNKLAAANDLKVKDVVQIWLFKFAETGKRGFAMVRIGDSNSNNFPISLTLSLRLPGRRGDFNNVLEARSNSDTFLLRTNNSGSGNERGIIEEANTGSTVTRGSSTEMVSTEPTLALPATSSDIDLTLSLGISESSKCS